MKFISRHRHLSTDVLSEYMDQRLSDEVRQRVSRQLESCAQCREELESLRNTVSLVQQLPELSPNRSFTFSASPSLVIVPHPFFALRMPNWAFAGAASLAGLALAVLVSADVTGVLAPAPQVSSLESADMEQPQAVQAAPHPPESAPQPAPAIAFSDSPAPAPTIDGSADQTRIRPQREPLATPESPYSRPSASDTGQPPEIAAAKSLEQPDSTVAPQPAGPRSLPAPESSQPETSPAIVSRTQPETLEPNQRSTPMRWRVLEAVMAALALVFILALVFKIGKSHRSI